MIKVGNIIRKSDNEVMSIGQINDHLWDELGKDEEQERNTYYHNWFNNMKPALRMGLNFEDLADGYEKYDQPVGARIAKFLSEHYRIESKEISEEEAEHMFIDGLIQVMMRMMSQ